MAFVPFLIEMSFKCFFAGGKSFKKRIRNNENKKESGQDWQAPSTIIGTSAAKIMDLKEIITSSVCANRCQGSDFIS